MRLWKIEFDKDAFGTSVLLAGFIGAAVAAGLTDVDWADSDRYEQMLGLVFIIGSAFLVSLPIGLAATAFLDPPIKRKRETFKYGLVAFVVVMLVGNLCSGLGFKF